MGPSLAARRDRCRDNAARTNEYANWANDRANDAQNHTHNSNNAMNAARSFWNDANNLLPQITTPADKAESLIRKLRSGIQTYADTIVTETTEERAALNKLVLTAEPEINRINGIATTVRTTSNAAVTDVGNRRGYIYENMPDSQSYVNSARYNAGEARRYADECKKTAYNRGDGGDDQRSNNDRKNCETHYNRAIDDNNKAKWVYDTFAWPRRSSAESLLNDIRGKVTTANQRLQATSDAIQTSATSGALKDVIKVMTDYGNDHNFDWIYGEIARIKPLKKVVDDKLPIDKAEEKKIKDQETEYNTALIASLEKLKADKAKGSIVDQTTSELDKLEKELTLCTDKIDEYKKNIKLTNARIAIISGELLKEQPNFTNAENNKKTAFDKMNEAEKNYNDLSGQLIQLEKDKSLLEGLITSEEANYSQLQQYIEKLKKNIIDLNIEDYSSKVFNNQNLLKFNQEIDKDLQNVFFDLKTENINPNLLFTKIKYREIEEEKLSNTDKLLDVLFYCFYFAFIIIRIVTRNTKTEDFLIYIFIGLIPFVYPFIYKNSNYIIHLFHLDMNKNSFIETESEISIDAYNI